LYHTGYVSKAKLTWSQREPLQKVSALFQGNSHCSALEVAMGGVEISITATVGTVSPESQWQSQLALQKQQQLKLFEDCNHPTGEKGQGTESRAENEAAFDNFSASISEDRNCQQIRLVTLLRNEKGKVGFSYSKTVLKTNGGGPATVCSVVPVSLWPTVTFVVHCSFSSAVPRQWNCLRDLRSAVLAPCSPSFRLASDCPLTF